jgi:protein-tyrosine phosphatase
MASILFVCVGNICRSPAAQGILTHMVAKEPRLQDLRIESCGLGDWHIGQLPDERIREAAKLRGVVLTSRAQIFQPHFFEQFDYILAVDHKVLHQLHRYANIPEHKAKIHLVTSFSVTYKDEEIPDPYYGEEAGFELVLDMLEDSCRGLLEDLLKKM